MNTSISNNPKAEPLKRNLILAAVALSLFVAGFITAYIKGNSKVSEQEAAYEKRIQVIESKLQTSEKQLAKAAVRNQLLTASAALYRTTTDLDKRNFGTANVHLSEATVALSAIDLNAEGIDNKKVAELGAATKVMDINVATDLALQREQVLQYAEQLDDIVKRSK